MCLFLVGYHGCQQLKTMTSVSVYFPYSFAAAISSSSALRCTSVLPDDAKVRHNSSQRLDMQI